LVPIGGVVSAGSNGGSTNAAGAQGSITLSYYS
jgi:hypothetical protein